MQTSGSTSPSTYDVVVIGAGSAGENVADRSVKGGLSALIVESDLLGGDCSYWACAPSKALLRPGQAVAAARRVDGARQAISGRLDVAKVLDRRDRFCEGWHDSEHVEWLKNAHVDLLRGHGRLAGLRCVEVETADGTVAVSARHAVVITTGSEPALPPVPGLDTVAPWTTNQATTAKQAPGHLVVLGGGVAGCELSQAWASLGSKVTVIENVERLLATFDPIAGELVAESMRESGIDVRLGVSVTGAERHLGGTVVVHLDDGSEVVGDELLVAAGRQPRTTDLGLDTVGLEAGGWLSVDDTMAVVGVPGVSDYWLYAAGDVNHRVLLTHQGKYQARICGHAIVARAGGRLDAAPWGRHCATADHSAVPQVVFTDPEVASVGLSEAEARDSGIAARVVDFALGDVAWASLYADDYRGHARMVVDDDRRVVVGATFVGPAAGELLHAATIAIVGEVPLDRLWHAVPAYPTISEVWLSLLESYGL